MMQTQTILIIFTKCLGEATKFRYCVIIVEMRLVTTLGVKIDLPPKMRPTEVRVSRVRCQAVNASAAAWAGVR